MTLREQRAGLRHLARTVGLDEHPRQPRMQWKPLHGPPGFGQRAVANRVEPREKPQRGVDGIRRRSFEPFETLRIAAPGNDIKRRAREIDPEHLRLAVRTEPGARVPQAPNDAGCRPRRASCPLIGSVRGNPLDVEAVDPPVRIVPRDLVKTGIDDYRDARHGHRCLRDVGRDDDATPRGSRRPERQILGFRVERSV